MTITELGSLGEFIASIAVLITLIVLVLQIRQNTAEIKVRADFDRSQATSVAGVALMGENTHESFTKALLRPSELEDTEIMHATWSAYTRGTCDREQWLGALVTARAAFAFPVGMAIWNELKKNYSHEMTDEIDAYLAEHGADWLQRQFGAMVQGVRQLPAAPWTS
jgi:hypothetical protein